MSTKTIPKLSTSPSTQEIAAALSSHGKMAWIGNYQVRNFHGYYQSREGGAGTWKFHISSFDSTSSGQTGNCSVNRVVGGPETVPIDAVDRITICSKKYGRKAWIH